MQIKVSDYIVNRLSEEGVRTIFGYQGGNISHLIDSIGISERVEFVETYHEQAAAFAANSYAQNNETIGVALASSGPGAINLLNGVANAFCDSIPCLFFTGDVNTTAKKSNGSQRQNSFQEINIVPMAKPISKYAISIDKPQDIVPELEKAILLAKNGRKGPVLINLPHDIQRSFINADEIEKTNFEIAQKNNYLSEKIAAVVNALKNSKRPIILVGGGMKDSECRHLLKAFLQKYPAPVVTSLLGMDVLSHDSQFYRGIVGGYGNRTANLCLKYADCILILGNRIDDRQIAPSNTKEFVDKTVIHVDIDEHEIENKLCESISIVNDVHEFLKQLLEEIPQVEHQKWLELTMKTKETFECEKESIVEKNVSPNNFLSEMSRQIEANYTFDVGNNQMHSMQAVFIGGTSKCFASGGLGSMGYSLPAAIGTCYPDKKSKAICITGDGGMQMNIQELQTVVSKRLPINIVLLNNQALGMIYDLQTKMFPGRFYGTVAGYDVPDFSKIAIAYGFTYFAVETQEDYQQAIDLLKNKIDVFVELKMQVPDVFKPDPGAGIFNQQPEIEERLLKEIEMEIHRI